MSTLYVVATPIGNLQDISLRALEVFKSVDIIICEDTRVTRKLLDHYKIKTRLIVYHQQSNIIQSKKVLDLFSQDIEAALVSDAGTPGIQDPGNKLVAEIIKKYKPAVKITPIPGPSALTTLASVSGLPTDSLLFLGYWPKKKGTQKVINEIRQAKRTVVFYETGPRIMKTLSLLAKIIDHRQVVVGRELTKHFETIYRGTAEEVFIQINNTSIKGEFVVLVGKN